MISRQPLCHDKGDACWYVAFQITRIYPDIDNCHRSPTPARQVSGIDFTSRNVRFLPLKSEPQLCYNH